MGNAPASKPLSAEAEPDLPQMQLEQPQAPLPPQHSPLAGVGKVPSRLLGGVKRAARGLANGVASAVSRLRGRGPAQPAPCYTVCVNLCQADGLPEGAARYAAAEVVLDGGERSTTPSLAGGAVAWNHNAEFVSQQRPQTIAVSLRQHSAASLVPLGPVFSASLQLEEAFWAPGGCWKWLHLQAADAPAPADGRPPLRLQVHVQCRSLEDEIDALGDFDFSHIVFAQVVEARGRPGSELSCRVSHGMRQFRTSLVPCGERWDQSCTFLVTPEADAPRLAVTLHRRTRLGRLAAVGAALVDLEQVLRDTDGGGGGADLVDRWYEMDVDSVRGMLQDRDLWLSSRPLSGSDEDGSRAEADEADGPDQGPAQVHLLIQALSRADIHALLARRMVAEFAEQGGSGGLSLSAVQLMLDTYGLEVGEDVLARAFEQHCSPAAAEVGADQLLGLLLRLSADVPLFGTRLLQMARDEVAASNGSAALMESAGPAGVVRVEPGRRSFVAVIDRSTGLVVRENLPGYIRVAMKAIYANRGSRMLRSQAARLLVRLSERQGRLYNDPKSAASIPDFVRLHQINLAEVERPLEEYATFNQFFSRRLRPGSRPPAGPPEAFLSPADCRLIAFPSVAAATRFWVKGAGFTVAGLLGPEVASRLAPRFEDCSLCIARLAPQDYHRWHVPVDGVLGRVTWIDGLLYSVNPIAVNQPVDVFTANKRVVCELESDLYGTVVMVVVGATMVGSIHLTAEPGARVQRGAEHGYFEFGGSTVIVLVGRDRVTFDADLLSNSQQQLETLVKCNSRIGVPFVPAAN